MPRNPRHYPVITFHRSGYSAYWNDGPNCSGTLSGYSCPEQFAVELADDSELDRASRGAWVVDMRDAVNEDPGRVIRAPMVDTRLADHEVHRFADGIRSLSEPMRASVGLMLSALPGSLNPGLAVWALADDEFSGLDYVSVPAYVAWWRANGARIGQVSGHRIEWRD